MINLDTVGRLGEQKLSVLGTGTATEWQHIFRGAGFVTGVESRNIAGVAAGVRPGELREEGRAGRADLHRRARRLPPPEATPPDKIDGPGLVKVATFVREGVTYLAERAEPLTNTIGPPSPGAGPAGARLRRDRLRRLRGGQRRVSFGTVPDFAFEGPGVRVTSVVPGSPAEKAGVQAGDVLMAIDGKPIANLQALLGRAPRALARPDRSRHRPARRQGGDGDRHARRAMMSGTIWVGDHFRSQIRNRERATC